jgi:hypothetical protein
MNLPKAKKFLSNHSRAAFLVFLAVSVACIFGYSFPFSRDFTYRFRHGLGNGLKSVSVGFVKDGEPVRISTYFYSRGPDRGPVSQDASVRLPPGRYRAVFGLDYLDGSVREITREVNVERFAFRYTVDVDDGNTKQ